MWCAERTLLTLEIIENSGLRRMSLALLPDDRYMVGFLKIIA